MTMKPLIEKLAHNLPAKIVCLLLAIFIYILFQFSTINRKSFSVPLEVQSFGDFVQTTETSNNIKVSVRGTSDEINQLTQNDFKPYIDLSYYTTEGTYRVPVQMELSANAVLLHPLEVQTSPSYITVSIEQRITRLVPITPILEGSPLENFFLDSWKLSPDMIEIQGPASLVNAKKEIFTKPILIEELNSNFVTSVEIDNNNTLITLDSQMDVEAEIYISEESVNNTYSNIPITFINVPDGISVSLDEFENAITPVGKTLTVEVSVPKTLVDAYTTPTFIATIDCSSISEVGTYDLPVTVSGPNRFEIHTVVPSVFKVYAMESIQ